MGTSSFSLDNFFIFLVEFAFSILFLIVFSAIHYGITQTTKLGKRIEKSKLVSFWYFFIFGFVLAVIEFIVSQVSMIAFGDIGMPITILGLIYAMTIFYNRSVQVGAIIPTILWVLFEYNGFTSINIECSMRIIIVVVMALVAFATTFVKWRPWLTFLLSCLVEFVAITLVLVSNINDNSAYYFTAVIISILVTIFYYAIIRYLNRLFTHMSTMAKQGAYIDKHYLIPNVLDQYFTQYIKQHNINQALVVSLLIKDKTKDKKILLDKIYDTFRKDKVLFFKSTYETYGFVVSGDMYQIQDLKQACLGNKLVARNDNLNALEHKLSKLNNDMTHIRAYVSVYGVHSCDLNSLLRNNQYALKHDSLDQNPNIVQMFNTNIRNQEISDNISYATLNQKVDLNEIQVELEIIRMNRNKKKYVCPRFYWNKLLTCDSATILNQFEQSIANTLLRNLAIRSMEQYSNNVQLHKYPLLIYYPIDQLNANTWSRSEFLKKIKLYGVNSNNIILSFNCNKLSVWPKQIIENLKDLEKHRFRYFLMDVVNLNGLKQLHPYGVVLDESIANRKTTSIFLKQNNLNLL